MNSKEVQLSLSFCGALAAVLLISAPINESTSLYGSGFSFLIAGGFFYRGITQYFAEKGNQALNATQQLELIIQSFDNNFTQYQNATKNQLQEVIAAIESLDDTLNDSIAKPLGEVSETLVTMSERVNSINTYTEYIERNTGKLKSLPKTVEDILDEIEKISQNIDNISKINDTLKELMRIMNKQEEFYQTMLNQYKNMTDKDVEMIDNLARKLR